MVLLALVSSLNVPQTPFFTEMTQATNPLVLCFQSLPVLSNNTQIYQGVASLKSHRRKHEDTGRKGSSPAGLEATRQLV